MRILLALAAVLLPGLAGASGYSSGPCPHSFHDPKRHPLDCLLDSRGELRAVLYEGARAYSREVVVHPRIGPPYSMASGYARSFREIPDLVRQLELHEPHRHPEPKPDLTPLSMNPPVPAPAGIPPGTRVTERTYDLFDRIETETVTLEDGGAATIRYTYYNDSRRRTTTDAFGRVTFYEYDGQARLSRVTASQGLPDEHVTTYEYWPDDLLKTVTKPNGTVTSYDYDRADRLTSIVIRRGADVLASYAYTYDPNGNRLTQVETSGGDPGLTTYTYDDLDRLETVTYPDHTSAAYEYDAVGNRTRETLRNASGVVVSDKTAVFDAINRLGTITDSVDPSQNATLTYDRNGNLLTKTTAAGTEEYDYDARDLLVETRSGTAITARFAYDAFGRRYLKIGAEGVRQYLYDETSTLHELDENDLEVAKYEYGGDRLASFFRRDEPRRFHHQDALGSVVALTDSAGSVVARYHLDAWGRYRVPAELDASRNRFGFTGYLFDQETDLYYAKARFYDPEIGRFTTQDSVVGQVDDPPSLNRYFYANANPTTFIDPTGHFSIKDFGKGALNVVMEPFRAVYDVSTVVGARAMGIPSDFIELHSMIGRSQQARIEEGQGGFMTAAKGAGDTVFGAVTIGIGPAVVSHVQLAHAYDRGEINIDQYDAALSEMAGGQAAAAAIAKAAGGRTVARPGTALQVQPKGAAAVRIIEGSRGAAVVPEGPIIEMVPNAEGTYVPAFEPKGTGPMALASVSRPGLPAEAEPAGLLQAPSTLRLAQDAGVKPNAPPPLALTRRIGSSMGQHAQLQADIAAALAQGATNVRVNQQQLDAAGNRTGTNRPDLQYTRPDGTRVHIEYDTPWSDRGLPHANRLLANDPTAVVETKTIK
jgi:RHS repeat-associated protein